MSCKKFRSICYVYTRTYNTSIYVLIYTSIYVLIYTSNIFYYNAFLST